MKFNEEQARTALCEALEAAIGRKMEKASDFDRMAEYVFEKTHEKVSTTTLKRLWGYLKEGNSPRESTLDILAQSLGETDWNAFCKKNFPTSEIQNQSDDDLHLKNVNREVFFKPFHPMRRYLFLLVPVVVIAIAGLAYWLFSKQTAKETNNAYVLRIGQKFATYEDYLQLFGITDCEIPYTVPVPHHTNIILFGGQYKHPNWGNEGDSAKLLPTFTYSYRNPDVAPEIVALRNADHYQLQRESNRLAITFMKNLVDSNFVFIGVYRMSLAHSDTTKITWERVAEEVDITHLEYLEHLRN